MSRKEEYKKANEQYLADLRRDLQVKELPGGILYTDELIWAVAR